MGYSNTGWGGVGELAFGGTTAPGLVIGGASYVAILPSVRPDSVTVNGASVPSRDTHSYSANLAMIGPFLDWYFIPTSGFHAQAALCLTRLVVVQGSDSHAFLDGFGFGSVWGVGYEWWVGAQWSLGVLGRVQVAFPTVSDQSGKNYSSVVFLPAVLMTATYH